MQQGMRICIFCLCTLFLTTTFGVIVRNSCPTVRVMPNLNVSALVGRWYEIGRHPNPWESGQCIRLNQSYTGNGKLHMHWEELREKPTGGLLYNDAESIASSGKMEKSRMSIAFMRPPLPFATPFWIVDTDYENYYVAYACARYIFRAPRYYNLRHYNLFAEFSWIMSRNKTLDDRTYIKLKRKLRSVGAIVRLIQRTTQHEGCEEEYEQYRPQNVTTTPKPSYGKDMHVEEMLQ